jgi:hypothetical protein
MKNENFFWQIEYVSFYALFLKGKLMLGGAVNYFKRYLNKAWHYLKVYARTQGGVGVIVTLHIFYRI